MFPFEKSDSISQDNIILGIITSEASQYLLIIKITSWYRSPFLWFGVFWLCLHLYYYIHNILADMSSSLLQVFLYIFLLPQKKKKKIVKWAQVKIIKLNLRNSDNRSRFFVLPTNHLLVKSTLNFIFLININKYGQENIINITWIDGLKLMSKTWFWVYKH